MFSPHILLYKINGRLAGQTCSGNGSQIHPFTLKSVHVFSTRVLVLSTCALSSTRVLVSSTCALSLVRVSSYRVHVLSVLSLPLSL